jgi:DNA/RNA-binding protein KIN17
MNATRWVTLTEFCKYLGREGIAHVDETEKGWFIAWIDNSPKALAKQAAAQKKERMDMDDEEKERKLIEEQIQRAKAAEEDRDKGEGSSSGGEEKEKEREKEKDVGEFKREEGQVIKLGFSKPKVEPSKDPEGSGNPSDTSAAPSAKPIGISLAAPAAKPKNIFKTMKASSTSASSKSNSSIPLPMAPVKLSAMEQIIQEDIERKRRRDESGWSERGYGKSGLQVSDREPKRQRVY